LSCAAQSLQNFGDECHREAHGQFIILCHAGLAIAEAGDGEREVLRVVGICQGIGAQAVFAASGETGAPAAFPQVGLNDAHDLAGVAINHHDIRLERHAVERRGSDGFDFTGRDARH